MMVVSFLLIPMRIYYLLVVLLMPNIVAAEALTIERIFASPSLSGPTLRSLKLSPVGDRVTFVRGKSTDREQLDLWEYHIDDGVTRLLVDSLVLQPEENLSEAEKARRERMRLAGLRGILDYQWTQAGDALLFPLAGDLYYYELESAAVKKLTNGEGFVTDPKLSPDGSQVAFVRNQNLYVIDIASTELRQLTSDGTDNLHNGEAEFAAQEEMDRDTGYWWSPDSSRIAYIQFDESPVPVTQRYEIDADNVTVVDQRYPYTGADNVVLKLGIVSAAGGATQWLDLGEATDFYLPRVQWLPNSTQLSYQWQSRDQKTLELRVVSLDHLSTALLLTESADTWVNLHHDLHFLDDHRYLWSSERDGFRHIYLYEGNQLLRQITGGAWGVDAIEGVNSDSNVVYFTANRDNVTEKQLYKASYTDAAAAIEQVTVRQGTHQISMSDSAAVYIDTFSNRDQPPQVSLHDANGKRLTWLQENALNDQHPYTAYLDQHQATTFGTLESLDGQTLHYRMLKPAGFVASRKYPVFVYVYGGPHVQVVSNSWGRRDLFEQYMAQQGFVVFSIDNRGSARRGTRFENAIHTRMGTVEVEDQLSGVAYLKSLPFVDAEKIGIFGWSYGGYMTLMSLLQGIDADAKSTYALGVSVAPVTDWKLYDTHYTERYMQTPRQNTRGYQVGNILRYTEKLPADGSVPLLLIHGMADDNVLFTHSTLLMKDLQDKNKLFDMMTYPGAKHGISGSASQTHVFRSIANYFAKLHE